MGGHVGFALVSLKVTVGFNMHLSQFHINAPSPRREVGNRNVRGLWKSDTRPVHPESVPGPGVACCLPQMCRVQPVSGRDLHLFRPGRKDLL